MITNGFEKIMVGLFGRSWRTTIAGLISLSTTVFLGIVSRPPKEPIAITLAKLIAGGSVSFGLLKAKDHNVSGQSPSRPEVESFDVRER